MNTTLSPTVKNSTPIKVKAVHPAIEQIRAFVKIYNYFNRRLFDKELPDCMLVLTHSDKPGHCGSFRWDRWEKSGGKIHEIALVIEYLALIMQDSREIYKGVNSKMDLFQTIVHEMVHLWQLLHERKHEEKETRKGYHDPLFMWKMASIGLMPSTHGTTLGYHVLKQKSYDKALDHIAEHTGRKPIQKSSQQMADFPVTPEMLKILKTTCSESGLIKKGPHKGRFSVSEVVTDKFWKCCQKLQHELPVLAVGPKVDTTAPIIAELGGLVQVVQATPQKPRKPKVKSRYKHTCPTCNGKAYGQKDRVLVCRGTRTDRHEDTEMKVED